jgi:Glucanosyltransferase
MKAYMAKQSNRQIPVGYSAADIVQNRFLLAEYLNCGESSEAIDFYAFNSYEWCGNSSFTYLPSTSTVLSGLRANKRQSGYDQLVDLFSNYSAPLFFSEYGCNLVEPREFTEVGAICSPPNRTMLI